MCYIFWCILERFRLWRAKYSKDFACGAQNTRKISPAARKILERFRLRRAKYTKEFACGGQNTRKNSPVAGKILERFRLRHGQNTQNQQKKSACGGQNSQKIRLQQAKYPKDFVCGRQNSLRCKRV